MRFFLLDKITEVRPGEFARGVKAVTLTDEVLHDHFPDFPVFPGSLMIEAAAQLGGYLVEVSGQPVVVDVPLRALLTQVQKAKFYEPVWPGDCVELRATLAARLDTAAEVRAELHVGERLVARMLLTFVLRRVDSERVHAQRRYLYKLWTRELKEAPNP